MTVHDVSGHIFCGTEVWNNHRRNVNVRCSEFMEQFFEVRKRKADNIYSSAKWFFELVKTIANKKQTLLLCSFCWRWRGCACSSCFASFSAFYCDYAFFCPFCVCLLLFLFFCRWWDSFASVHCPSSLCVGKYNTVLNRGDSTAPNCGTDVGTMLDIETIMFLMSGI